MRIPRWSGAFSCLLLVCLAITAALVIYPIPATPPPPAGPTVRILAIGDSITQGIPLWPPDHATDRMGEALAAIGVAATILNRGHGGSSAESWAEDRERIFSNSLAAARSAGFQSGDLAWIMLGTNDAQYGHDPDGFESDLRSLCDRLRAEGYRPVLNVVPWQTPAELTSSRVQGEVRIKLLREINARIVAVADSGSAEMGDGTAYEHFRTHPDHLDDGLHPNKVGATHLGRAWARAAARLIPVVDWHGRRETSPVER